jgi:hypothetical protein
MGFKLKVTGDIGRYRVYVAVFATREAAEVYRGLVLERFGTLGSHPERVKVIRTTLPVNALVMGNKCVWLVEPCPDEIRAPSILNSKSEDRMLFAW